MRRTGAFAQLFMIFSPFFAAFSAAEDLIISGWLEFPGGRPTIPLGSTYRVTLQDISLADAASETLCVFKGNAEKANDGAALNFELRLSDEERQRRRNRHLAVAAVVNIGWEAEDGGSEWIRRGDFMNEFVETVHHSDETNTIDNFIVRMRQV